MLNMQDLLTQLMEKKASDLHITAGLAPMLRIDGEVMETHNEKLTPDICQRLVYSLLTDAQKEKFESTNELDLSFGIKGIGRVRMNVFRQRGSVAAALRSIPQKIMTFEELNLPPVVDDIMKINKGLILVTGPTGSGKSTTLASMIDYLNMNRSGHIITIEDPIEYVHLHKKSIVNQREVSSDTTSFPSALKYVLRQDPDIILIGEMRDLETISAALTIAETGHLVFATLHTTDAASTVNRIIDVFPPHQQPQIRSQLSFVLQAIFAQQLLLHSSGSGRVLSSEVMIVTPAIRNLIREMKIEQIYLSMQTGGKFGMQTMNQSLFDLYTKRKITYQTALNASTDLEDLKRILSKATV
ncbi:MAG TPA: type IV pili twitching motility protein PilT [Elusimicrobia bacterium]|nr:MAG: type IV pili twitching motility protein PilT [Elusimicrobia bacterium RIFOXYA12_FULL_49_49]OGS15927.1 MAG: type IV pili twitching motility protein PilT [Elusimicrobia bacterium RIFOXYA2_FULL_47_53]OGS26391.1 MAG: type IV pili twitching motility protein PilT [Elusimicrobia bacterium RIFOXYB12_FULL_50_12]OGS29095.1 MAG: type IV pili twitching motility protein PilT [Elusimicrobia bacterium RIFOXYB2_FULL_46_23]HBU69178.1 type IV pili twitching motility protein PilT [Elusimicrobiota bacteriu